MNDILTRVEAARNIFEQSKSYVDFACKKRGEIQNKYEMKIKLTKIGMGLAGLLVFIFFPEVLKSQGIEILENLAVFLAVCVLPGFFLIKYYKKLKGTYDAGMEEANQTEAYGKRIPGLSEEVVNILPEEYRSLEAAEYICEVLKNGEARTLKEAFRMCDTQFHEQKMARIKAAIAQNDRMIADNNRTVKRISEDMTRMHDEAERKFWAS